MNVALQTMLMFKHNFLSFLTLLLALFQLSQTITVKGKRISVDEYQFRDAINRASIKFSILPTQLQDFDLFSLIIDDYDYDVNKMFDVGRSPDDSSKLSFYLPSSSSVEDFLTHSLANRLGCVDETDLFETITASISNTFAFAAARSSRPKLVDLIFSVYDSAQIFYENFSLKNRKLHVSDGQENDEESEADDENALNANHDNDEQSNRDESGDSMSEPDVEITLQMLRGNDLVVFISNSYYDVDEFVATIADGLNAKFNPDSNFVNRIVAELSFPSDSNVRTFKWEELKGEIEKYAIRPTEQTKIVKAPGKDDCINLSTVDPSMIDSCSKKIYRCFGKVLADKNATEADTLIAHFTAAIDSENQYDSMEKAFEFILDKCNEDFAAQCNAESLQDDLEFDLFDVPISEVNDSIKTILQDQTQSLELQSFSTEQLLGGEFSMTLGNIHCFNFPYIDDVMTDEALIEDYAKFVASKMDPKLSRSAAIGLFIEQFKSRQKLNEYAVELSLRPIQKHVSPGAGTTAGRGTGTTTGKGIRKTAGKKATSQAGSHSQAKGSGKGLKYGLLFGIPLGLLLIVVPLVIYAQCYKKPTATGI